MLIEQLIIIRMGSDLRSNCSLLICPPFGDGNIPTEVQGGHLNIMYLNIYMNVIRSYYIWKLMEL